MYVCTYVHILVPIHHLIQEQLRLQLVSEGESHKTQLETSEKEREAVQVCAHMYVYTYVYAHVCTYIRTYICVPNLVATYVWTYVYQLPCTQFVVL